MKNYIILLLCSFVIFSCGNVKTVEQLNDDGKVEEKYSVNKKTQKKEGKLFRYYKDGSVFEESNYKNDLLNGERKMYYENGKIQILENYIDGEFDGPYFTYHQNGKVDNEGVYTAGMMQGKWKRFYDNGQLREEVLFKDNQENGPFIEYYENGKLKAEGAYLDGDNEHGELKMYDETGTLVKKMDCNRGVCRTTWKAEE